MTGMEQPQAEREHQGFKWKEAGTEAVRPLGKVSHA